MTLEDKHGTNGLSYQIEVGTRLGLVADLLNTRTYAAKAAGVSVDMLSRYIKGSSKQSFSAIVSLCSMAGVSLDWVATGVGVMMVKDVQGGNQVADRDTYLRALLVIEEVLQDANMDIKPDKKVRLVELVAEKIEKENTNAVKQHVAQLVSLAS